MLDRIVEIIETYDSDPFPSNILAEWNKLNEDLRQLEEEPSYGLGFWHKGYEIELYGRKILYGKMTKEEYSDMLEMFAGGMKIDDYKQKWN